jgi:hypothetical protein
MPELRRQSCAQTDPTRQQAHEQPAISAARIQSGLLKIDLMARGVLGRERERRTTWTENVHERRRDERTTQKNRA